MSWNKSGKITKLVLKQEGGSTEYPITSFSVRKAVNAIPVAGMSIAIGERFADRAKKQFLASKDELSKPFQLLITVDGEERELLYGYITSVTESRSNNPVSGQIRLDVQLAHEAVRLQGLAPAAFRYWSSGIKAIGMVASLKNPVNAAVNEPLIMLPAIVGETKSAGTVVEVPSLIVNSAAALQATVELGTAAQAGSSESSGKELIKKLIKPADVKFSPEVVQADNIIKVLYSSIYDNYYQSYSSTNVWQALMAVSNYYMLMLVPRGREMSMEPAFFWKKSPDFTITPDMVLGVERTKDTSVYYDHIDAVAVSVPVALYPTGAGEMYALYPDPVDGPQNMFPVTGRALLVNTLPDYLRSAILADTQCELQEENTKDDEGKPTAAKPDKKDDPKERAEAGKSISKIWAKLEFAAAAYAKYTLSLAVRWDLLDFMDQVGYLMRVEGLGKPGVSPESQVFFGMLSEVTLTGRSPAEGAANIGLSLSFTHVRPEEINSEYALDENPLYVATGGSAT